MSHVTLTRNNKRYRKVLDEHTFRIMLATGVVAFLIPLTAALFGY
jgi:hypothetical protein